MSATTPAGNNPQLPPSGGAPEPARKRKTAAEVKAEIAAQAKAEAKAEAAEEIRKAKEETQVANDEATKAINRFNRLVDEKKVSTRRTLLIALLIAGLTVAAAFAYNQLYAGKAATVTQNSGGATSSAVVNVPSVTPPAATPPATQPLVSVPPVTPSQEQPKDAAPATPKADPAQSEAKVAIPASGVNQTVTITIGGGCGSNVCATAKAAPAVQVHNAPNARREAVAAKSVAAAPQAQAASDVTPVAACTTTPCVPKDTLTDIVGKAPEKRSDGLCVMHTDIGYTFRTSRDNKTGELVATLLDRNEKPIEGVQKRTLRGQRSTGDCLKDMAIVEANWDGLRKSWDLPSHCKLLGKQ